MTAPALSDARRLIWRALRRIMRPTGDYSHGSGMGVAWVCGTSKSGWRRSTPAGRRFILKMEPAGGAPAQSCFPSAGLVGEPYIEDGKSGFLLRATRARAALAPAWPT